MGTVSDSRLRTIATGTVFTSAASAFITGLHGIFTNKPDFRTRAGTSALSAGFTAANFFTLREYVFSPLLASAFLQTVPTTTAAPDEIAPLSWREIRTRKLIDSGMSGAVTGGLLRGLRSGAKAILPGSMTAGVICMFLQWTYNELDIVRIKMLAKPASTATAIPQENSRPGLVSTLLTGMGLQQLSREEYLEKLKATREEHLRRIEELERQLAEDSRRNSKDDSSNQS